MLLIAGEQGGLREASIPKEMERLQIREEYEKKEKQKEREKEEKERQKQERRKGKKEGADLPG